MPTPLERLQTLAEKLESTLIYERSRKENYQRLRALFFELKLDEKVENFEAIFHFKAMNLLGVSLTKEALGAIQKKRYVQILAIQNSLKGRGNDSYSLGYYGKSEALDESLKDKIVEFVLRWRYEKSFYHVNFYQELIALHTKE